MRKDIDLLCAAAKSFWSFATETADWLEFQNKDQTARLFWAWATETAKMYEDGIRAMNALA